MSNQKILLSGLFAFVDSQNTVATLTTDWTRAPGADTHCLMFWFILGGQGSTLEVAVELLGSSQTTVWATTQGNATENWNYGMIPITGFTAHRVSNQNCKNKTKQKTNKQTNKTHGDGVQKVSHTTAQMSLEPTIYHWW